MRNLYVQVALKPILVSGVLCVVYFLFLYFVGIPLFSGFMGLEVLIPIPFCGITLYFFKKHYNNGELRFWQGMILSEGVMVGSLVLFSFYLMLHFYFFAPDYLNESIVIKNKELIKYMDFYISSGRTEEEINQQMLQLKETTVGSILSDKIIRFSLFGFFYSVFLSIVFRK